jgi:uncharacterized membrane protein
VSVSVPALALISALLSAIATILIRHGLVSYSAYTGFWINLVVGTVCLWLGVLFTGGMGNPTPQALLLFVSIEVVGASITAGFMNVTPLVSSALAIVLLGERLTGPIVAGTLVIVLGSTLLSTGGQRLGLRPGQLLLPALSAACFGVVAILRKLGLSGMGAVPGTAVNVTTALVAFTGFLVASGQGGAMACRGRSLVYFVAAGVAENVSVFLVVVALGMGAVSVVAPLQNVTPIFVLFLSVVFLRGLEVLNARVIAGTALIVVGAWLITALGPR